MSIGHVNLQKHKLPILAICVSLALAMSLFWVVSVSAVTAAWKIYTNKKLGYALSYPANAQVTVSGKDIREGFYLDPLQPIADLMRNPAFAKAYVDLASAVKITFPDKYLIILTINHMPKHTPPAGQPVKIGQYTFDAQHSSDAAMCHDYEYDTYFLAHGSQYYAFIFLRTSNCFADEKPAMLNHSQVKTQNFANILRTVRLF